MSLTSRLFIPLVYSDESALTEAVFLVTDIVQVFGALKSVLISCLFHKHYCLTTENEEATKQVKESPCRNDGWRWGDVSCPIV